MTAKKAQSTTRTLASLDDAARATLPPFIVAILDGYQQQVAELTAKTSEALAAMPETVAYDPVFALLHKVGAPSEEEVGAFVLACLTERNGSEAPEVSLAHEIDDIAAMLWAPARDILECPDPRASHHEYGLWCNLRPSEAERLMELVNAASKRAGERSRTIVLEELTAAGVAFAVEYPDAPRGVPST